MAEPTPTGKKEGWWELEAVGPATLAQVMEEVEQQVARGDVARFQPLATGFDPLDDVLNGGLRRGELMIVGGPYGVGKTIFALQVARNVVRSDERNSAIYVCYEHDRAHLMSRLLCLESAEENSKGEALTLRRLAELALSTPNGVGLISRLRRMPRYAAVVETMASTLRRCGGDDGLLRQPP